jgi:HK97 gp10 family phage protein
VDTGFLKNSISVEPAGDLTAYVGPHAEYAIYVEYGTYKSRAQPYLLPSAEKVRPAFIAAMKQIAKM